MSRPAALAEVAPTELAIEIDRVGSSPTTPAPILPGDVESLTVPAVSFCHPGQACSPGQEVGSPLVALSPADARDALLAVRLLDQVELDLDEARDLTAQLQAQLATCSGQEPDCPAVEPEGWGERWLSRAGWLMSGVAIGLGVGLWMAVW